MSDCYRETRRTARKAHTCCECEAPIDKGEQYVRWHGVTDDGAYGETLCLFCYHLAVLLMREHDDEHAFGGLYESLKEWALDDERPLLRSLFPRVVLTYAEDDARWRAAQSRRFKRGTRNRAYFVARHSVAMRDVMRWRAVVGAA